MQKCWRVGFGGASARAPPRTARAARRSADPSGLRARAPALERAAVLLRLQPTLRRPGGRARRPARPGLVEGRGDEGPDLLAGVVPGPGLVAGGLAPDHEPAVGVEPALAPPAEPCARRGGE